MESKVAFAAYAEPLDRQAKLSSSNFKIMLVTMDCLLLGLQPVLVHMSKNSKGTYSFDPISVNFLVEVAKALFALAMLLFLGTGRPGPPMYRSVHSFIADAHHNRLLAFPAALYAVNNYLKFTLQLYFRPTTTKMLGNLKIFTIALLMRALLGRTFNIIQWEALFLLVTGITVNQLHGGCASDATDVPVPLLAAGLCLALSVTVPAAAAVYNEFALKKHMDTSVHLQNFFLYFYGAVFNGISLLVSNTWAGRSLMGMFHGLGTVTLILIINNAAQGILSSFFFKFADTILKKYSSTIATLFTAVMSYAMFGHELTLNFIIGVSVVFISMHQFFTFGDKQPPGAERTSKSGRIAYSPSLEHLAAATHSGGLSLQVEGNNGHIPGGLGARTDLANAKNRSDADIAARASA